MTNDVATIDVVVRDGSTVCLRRAAESDVPALQEFLESLSVDSRYHRFMGLPALTESRVRALATADGSLGTALVVEARGRIVAFAGFYRDAQHRNRAEVAFVVSDALQGHGIGTRLLERLAAIAREHGIDTFDADVLGDNQRMLDVFRESGFAMATRVEHGAYRVTLSLSTTDAFADKSAARSRAAATASMKAFFEPRTVAVIGANRERGKIGSEILHNLVAYGFTGTVVAVHPRAQQIDGIPAYPRIGDVPGPVDLAVIVVPADQVLAAVDECISKDVRAICVISAGFSECGEDGRAREAALVDRIRRAGCRLIGPNCMGLLNSDPAVRLNATFSPVSPPAGRVAMSTQSGALGLAILDYAKRLNIGISSFVSVGNKPDVSGNDLIQYLGGRPANVRHSSVPRELRKPEEVQRDRQARGEDQADCGGQGGPVVGRVARGELPYWCARHERYRRRCPVPPGGRHPNGTARRAVRRGGTAGQPARASRTPGRDTDERGRPRHPRR